MECKECYIRYENETLFVGNERFERVFRLDKSGLYTHSLHDKSENYDWTREGYSDACLYSAQTGAQIHFETERLNDGEGLEARITFEYPNAQSEIIISVRAGLPFYTMRLPNASGGLLEDIPLPKAHHYQIRAVQLLDQTDGRDQLVREETRLLWSSGQIRMNGTLFFVEDYLNGPTLLLLRELPSYRVGQGDFLCADKNRVKLMGQAENYTADDGAAGYEVTVGVGRASELSELYKGYYQSQRELSGRRETFCMSNTWGDRNQDGALNENFVRKEIELAASMGVDAVQLDDGWQQGITANSCLQANGAWDGGYYKADEGFWKVHSVKFPHGLTPLTDEAAKNGVLLGLWFSPDSAEDFANWKRDADTLVELHKSYHIRFFKLDGIRIENQLAEQRYLRLLEDVTERTEGKVIFNLDITAGRRLGYFWHKEHGTLFVENRYTDWGNYWPHNTLKNLWQLSRYLPAQRLQMEVLNNRRNESVYGDDPLAPATYTADYLFAITMVSNPLLWMELSGLSETDRERLSGIITVYKQHRCRFSESQVIPIGESPNGAALTGFQLICAKQGEGYLLLFREHTDRQEITLPLTGLFGKHIELLYSNCKETELGLTVTEEGLCHARIGMERGYVLWHCRAE